jgi:CRP/FNR family transcriptional regulator, cyclic AMP receptor protein
MKSNAGRRIIFGIANPGETLGLASALSGSRYDITAETMCPCRIASLDREEFLAFLVRNPTAYGNLVRELCMDCARACEQVRTLGLTATAPAKLARLLLEWCAGGQKTERGTRLFCSLTHGEIGECIGASRETVTRIFSDFRYQELLESRGHLLPTTGQFA